MVLKEKSRQKRVLKVAVLKMLVIIAVLLWQGSYRVTKEIIANKAKAHLAFDNIYPLLKPNDIIKLFSCG